MGDRSGSPSRVCTSEDRVRRKDLCGSVRAVYIIEKLPDVSESDLVKTGRYTSSIYPLADVALYRLKLRCKKMIFKIERSISSVIVDKKEGNRPRK
jgi:hypothetical protein